MRKRIHNSMGRNFNKKRTPDLLSKRKRSSLMSKIRSTKTNFEKEFIKELRKCVKERMRFNVKTIKGKPDIVFPKKKLCVFLDSDFWHGWQYPRWKHLLKDDFWRNKIESNRKRDIKTTNFLKNKGWRIIRLREHNINNNIQYSLKKIVDRL